MLEGKLIIIPALGHQNKGKSSFTGSGLFVLMSQCGNNNELALQHGGFVPCDRKVQKPIVSLKLFSLDEKTHNTALLGWPLIISTSQCRFSSILAMRFFSSSKNWISSNFFISTLSAFFFLSLKVSLTASFVSLRIGIANRGKVLETEVSLCSLLGLFFLDKQDNAVQR